MVIHNTNNFRTEYHARPAGLQVDHASKLLTIGSCFSDNIGQKLLSDKFEVLVNPFGTVYNPVSIFNLLAAESIDPDKFVNVDGQFYHLDFHSQYTAQDQQTLEVILTSRLEAVKSYLAQANFVFITLGTAFVYETIASRAIVANCHKVPQKHFVKRLLSLEEMSVAFDCLKRKIEEVNPELQFIFTVSPVRHIKDGIIDNQLSKSLLRVLCDECQNQGAGYFPAYEMMMDDLRDYRFYKTDMIHPSEMAEDYIWGKFGQTYFSDQTRKVLKEWGKVQAALSHRPFHPGSENHQKFLRDQLSKLSIFSEYFDVESERNILQQQLQS
ncbi:GSCFA domain-containing protein [Reichenbachiella carrageenanivorans]|uniref:GSCFA domain-containing protein n=1 Tax=Reichenbachiella carrageenanivorans TaxID=2979869 RepID=A0ABY6CXU9_9BACT|nr:GSCFA domain-containing protein [Reichenbachiella carrageenanivorans]UXX78749.1 GSCFA domain-containing protein [Reichenbachiella carrageenanivorans]